MALEKKNPFEFHNSYKCLKEIYYNLTHQKDVYTAYEFTVTIDQSNQTWTKAENSTYLRVISLINETSPANFMLLPEHHENGWIHFHGIVWWYNLMESNRYLNKKFNKKIGRSQVVALRDGKIEHLMKKYDDWFKYITKDFDTEKKAWIRNRLGCTCGLHEFFSYEKVETNDKQEKSTCSQK